MNYTTIEQSKKLLELGLNPDSADMFYNEEPDECYPKDIVDTKYPMVIREGQKHYLKEYGVPCWSLGALLELMPKIKEDEDDGGCYPTLCKGYNTDKWHCVYRGSIYITNWCDTSIDAAFEMVLWLLENGFLNKE